MSSVRSQFKIRAYVWGSHKTQSSWVKLKRSLYINSKTQFYTQTTSCLPYRTLPSSSFCVPSTLCPSKTLLLSSYQLLPQGSDNTCNPAKQVGDSNIIETAFTEGLLFWKSDSRTYALKLL